MTTFDTLIEFPLHEKPLAEVTGNEFSTFGPRGSTALYDAVGKTLEATKQEGYDKILTVIVTDGQENSSREWTKDGLHSAIEAKINLGNWTFTYLGTQPETWADADSIGVGVGAGAVYTAANIGATYKVMGQRTNSMAGSATRGTRSFLSDDQFGDPDCIQAMAAVGMKVNQGPDPVTISQAQTVVPPPPPSIPAPAPAPAKKPDTRKWR